MASLVELFSKEDRVEVTFSNFYEMMKEATKADIARDAYERYVDSSHILEVLFGEKVEDIAYLDEEM